MITKEEKSNNKFWLRNIAIGILLEINCKKKEYECLVTGRMKSKNDKMKRSQESHL